MSNNSVRDLMMVSVVSLTTNSNKTTRCGKPLGEGTVNSLTPLAIEEFEEIVGQMSPSTIYSLEVTDEYNAEFTFLKRGGK
jgi:hypothetical protein